jgi:hypothetical protein
VKDVGATGLSALKDFRRLERLSVSTFGSGAGQADLSALAGLKWLTLNEDRHQKEPVRLPENLRRLHVWHKTVAKLGLVCRSTSSTSKSDWTAVSAIS